jgi:hypothetical protein
VDLFFGVDGPALADPNRSPQARAARRSRSGTAQR